MKLIAWMIQEIQDVESIRIGNSHVASRPVSFPPHPILEVMPSRSIGMPSRKEGPPSIWDMVYRETFFADPVAFSSASCHQELNSWNSHMSEPIHSSAAEKNENRSPVQDQRCQSGPSAKNSVIPSETNNDCRFQIFIFTNSPLQQR